ncbi:MAG: hypothetical protein Q9227_003524 [Pyrenula ochraceoflavens]
MAAGVPGTVYIYEPSKKLVLFEHAHASAGIHSLLVVGGLGDGLTSLPFIAPLAQALQPTQWRVIEVQLSSSNVNWGLRNLRDDADELAVAVGFVRNLNRRGGIVLMGSSTGSQDVMTYLTSQNGDQPLFELPVYPQIDGAVLQAPVSDKESLLWTNFPTGVEDDSTDKGQALKHCLGLAEEHHDQYPLFRQFPQAYPKLILPSRETAKLDLGAEVTTERFLSLWGKSFGPGPTIDDIFSSDLSPAHLQRTFGQVDPVSRLVPGSPLLILLSGDDEFVSPRLDMLRLLETWKHALDPVKLAPESGIIPGAKHNGSGQSDREIAGRDEIVKRVLEYLNQIFALQDDKVI